jgi:hypothetical protein
MNVNLWFDKAPFCQTHPKEKSNLFLVFSCDGKTGCTVSSGSSFAGGDPCGGTTKYTEVVHNCVWWNTL